jgi:plasmid stabilization system protein ParE
VSRVKRTSRAKQDLLEHVLYLAKINLDLAEKFIDASEVAFAKLSQMLLSFPELSSEEEEVIADLVM